MQIRYLDGEVVEIVRTRITCQGHRVYRVERNGVVIDRVVGDIEIKRLVDLLEQKKPWIHDNGDGSETIHYPDKQVEREIPILMIIFPFIPAESWDDYQYRNLHEKVAAAGAAAGFEVLDLYDVFAASEPSSLRNSDKDPHPNGLAFGLVAEVVQAAVRPLLR